MRLKSFALCFRPSDNIRLVHTSVFLLSTAYQLRRLVISNYIYTYCLNIYKTA